MPVIRPAGAELTRNAKEPDASPTRVWLPLECPAHYPALSFILFHRIPSALVAGVRALAYFRGFM